MNFVAELRRNLTFIQTLLQAWVVKTIEDNRPMWLDDGTEVGRGNVINYAGTVTKVGDQINLSGGTSTSAHDIEGASHTAAGLTAGDVMLAEGATTFGFGPLTDGMIPSTIARDTEITTAISNHVTESNPHAEYILKATMTAKGDLLVASAASLPVRLAAGTADQVPTSDGSGNIAYAVPKSVSYIVFGTEEQTYVA